MRRSRVFFRLSRAAQPFPPRGEGAVCAEGVGELDEREAGEHLRVASLGLAGEHVGAQPSAR